MINRPEGRFKERWTPRRPYAADDYTRGTMRMSREAALTKRHIELDPRAQRSWIAMDIDHDDAFVRACSGGQKLWPNAVIENPDNGHAHAVWKLADPVTMTMRGRDHPKRYAAHVASGITLLTDADRSYNSMLIKNPEHHWWGAHWIHDQAYSLGDLHKELAMLGALPSSKELPVHTQTDDVYGRQHTLFTRIRKWAYREARYYTDANDAEGFVIAVVDQAHRFNANAFEEGVFPAMLPTREVEHTARQISKWIITRSDLLWKPRAQYDETFKKIQAARGNRSGRARADVSQARADDAEKALLELLGKE